MKIFLLEDKFLQGLQQGFLRSKENVILNHFQHFGWVMFICPVVFMNTVVNGNYIAMTVVVAIVIYWQMLCLEFCGTIMFLYVWQMESHCGRCSWHLYVIYLCGQWKATVADLIATCVE